MKRALHTATIIVLTSIIMLAGAVLVNAQNTGSAPYLGSKHAYKIKVDDPDNDQRDWIVTDKNLLTRTFVKGTTGHDWFSITAAPGLNTEEIVEIYFVDSVFSYGTYYLQYFEYDDVNSCISAREFPIVIEENTFFIELGAEVFLCNDESDSIHAKTDIEDGDDFFNTEVTYSFTMKKEADYEPDYWEFSFEFSEDLSELPVLEINPTAGVFRTLNTITANRKYSIIVDRVTAGLTEVDVNIKASFNNLVVNNLDDYVRPSMTISNAQAVVVGTVPTPNAITEDNEAIYPIPPPDNRIQIATIYDIPLTNDIVPVAPDDAITASSPVAGSTHKYQAELSGVGNINRGESGWTIELDDRTPVAAAGNYIIVEDKTGDPVSVATVTFNKAMSDGIYYLVYSEQNENGCISSRRYPINLQVPIDIDIVAQSNQCAGISNSYFIDAASANGTTSIDYEIKLESAAYTAGWSFDFVVSANKAWDANDVDVQAGGISVTDGAYTAGATKYEGAVSVAAGITTVTLTVTYEGYYVSDYNLIITLNEIKGAFNGPDIDAVNETTHTLFALPQLSALTPVE